jgi:prevent-host-death family protein
VWLGSSFSGANKSYNYIMNVATIPLSSEVGIRELKNRLSAYLERVQAGEEFVVTDHGQPIARLGGLTPPINRMAELIAAGVIQPSTRKRSLPASRIALSGISINELAKEQRR